MAKSKPFAIPNNPNAIDTTQVTMYNREIIEKFQEIQCQLNNLAQIILKSQMCDLNLIKTDSYSQELLVANIPQIVSDCASSLPLDLSVSSRNSRNNNYYSCCQEGEGDEETVTVPSSKTNFDTLVEAAALIESECDISDSYSHNKELQMETNTESFLYTNRKQCHETFKKSGANIEKKCKELKKKTGCKVYYRTEFKTVSGKTVFYEYGDPTIVKANESLSVSGALKRKMPISEKSKQNIISQACRTRQDTFKSFRHFGGEVTAA